MMNKQSRDNSLLFIDTFQSETKIYAIALKIRTPSRRWIIHIHTDDMTKVDAEALKEAYGDMAKQPWLETYLADPVTFDVKSYYTHRYDNISFEPKDEFIDCLQTYDITLVDTGEATSWFNRFIREAHMSYSVRQFSLAEVGDEREFILPVYYSKTDLNEIDSRLDSIKLKYLDLQNKYGEGVRTLKKFKALIKLLKHGVDI